MTITTINTKAEFIDLFSDPELRAVRFYGEEVFTRDAYRLFPADGKPLGFILCYRSRYE